MSNDFKLKKSLLIQTLAVAFILAPLGNLAGELFMSQSEGWFNPANWARLFASLSWLDKLLLLAISGSGFALLIQKKASWFLAVVVLVWISVHNILFFLNHEGPIWSIRLVPALFNLPVLVILYHFRFPYLDKRDHIIGGFQPRTNVNEAVKISGNAMNLSSLSENGCFVSGDLKAEEGEIHELELSVDLKVSIQLLYKFKNGWGAKFNDLTRDQKKLVKKFLAESQLPEEGVLEEPDESGSKNA